MRNATIDFFPREANEPKRISLQAYDERIKRRERYELRPKERPDSEGYARYQHPKGYRHQCRRGKPIPKACEQSTITIPPKLGAKHEQSYPYRSQKWQDHYSAGRQSVESMNKFD